MKRLLAAAVTAALVVATAPIVRADERPDAGKRALELPTEELVRDTRTDEGRLPAETNPRVAAGVVEWHADLATARTAARRSGRPVLLFQLLGRLDEEFC